MKNLYDLYSVDVNVSDVKTNSKDILKNDIFVCTKGVNYDRHLFIYDAIRRKAAFLVTTKGKYTVPYIKVKNIGKELVNVCNYIYEDAKKMDIIAVTGTDGKTTVSMIMRDMLGYDKCGYIGTNGVIGKYLRIPTDNTTPLLELNYKYLDSFYKEGLSTASIEASSIGMLYKRLDGLSFKRAIFTNFTEDHLDIHKSLDNYLKCKRKVFLNLSTDGMAIINRDDPNYLKFKKSSKGKCLTYGKSKYSNLRIVNYIILENGTYIEYSYKKEKFLIFSPLVGRFNVYNISACILCLLSLGYDTETIRKRALNIKKPFGRAEFLDYHTNYKIFVDYAHTANGIFEVLTFLNTIKKGKIITVMGSAGEREKEKRSLMGKNAQMLSDIVIYTMDDPRSENVLSIISDLIDNSKSNYLVIEKRDKAIEKALDMAEKDDIVAILGKGRDNYMAIGDKKVLYSDIWVLDKYFNKY